MPEFVRLQIRPGQPGPTIELHSSGAQVPAVPLLPLPMPPGPPVDSTALWQALPEPIRQSLRQVQNVPLWLDIDPRLHDIAAWPWELLAPPKSPPFACMPHTPLVRAFPAQRTAPLITPGVPRLLALTATPRDQPTIDVQPLLHLLRNLHDPQRLLVTVKQHCSPQQLPTLIRDTQPDLLLILAHGTPGDMILEDERGDSVPLPAGELATFLSGALTRVVVLASCHGATTTDDGQSVATTLLEQGALAVVAMRGRMPQNAADAFLRGMLRGLAHPYPLEVAVAYGRQALIAALGAAGGDWALPVCWQQVLGRPLLPLTLPRDQVARQGARWLEKQADNPSLVGKLATGGWIGFLLFASLHSLFWPAAMTVPAIVTLLEGLGLNIASGYLGNALEDMVRRTVGRPRETVSQPEVLQALLQVADQHADAAAEIAAFARDTGALQQTLGAIQQGVAGSGELLVGLTHDSRRHGEALELLRADLRRGLGAVYQVALSIEGDTTMIRSQTTELLRLAREDRAAFRALAQRLGEEQRRRQQDEAVLLRGYLGTLSEQCNQLSLADADSSDPNKAAVDLDSVYIRLETTRTVQREERSYEEPRHLTALEVLAQHPRMVLLGGPGSGKSTFVNFLTRCLAQHFLTCEAAWLEKLGAEWPHGGLFPVRIILREFAAWIAAQQPRIVQGSADLVWRFIAAQPGNNGPALAAVLCRYAHAGQTLVLFDGLDEVGTDEAGWPLVPVRESITALASSLGTGSRVLVTCRILDYQQQPQRQLHTWPDETLIALSDALQEMFIHNWYRELARLGRPMNDTAEVLEQRLQQQVRTRLELRRLAGNPLLLTMMTLVHAYKGRLPEERVRLYDECIEFLLHRWRVRPDQQSLRELLNLPQWSETNLYDLLELLGHAAHARGVHPDGESGADLPYDVLISVARHYFESYGKNSYTRAETFAAYIGEASNGVLQVYERQRANAAIYRFPHRTFQEYLAGRALTNDSLRLVDEPDEAERDLVTRALRYVDSGAQWREALLLAASRHTLVGRRSREVVDLARDLQQDVDTASLSQIQRVQRRILAGEVLLEVGREGIARLRTPQIAVWRQTQASLLHLMTTPAELTLLAPVDRDRAALVLAQLVDPLDPSIPGDTRPGVCTLEPAWCALPAGEYILGTQRDPFNDKTHKPHRMRLGAFRIARYPVTVWQFHQFWQASGYDDEQWWTPEGWQWLQPGSVRYDWQEKGRITKPYVWDAPDWTADNQPVVGVSWYEAVAFCNWLTHVGHEQGWLQANEQIRLPTEAEWEVAAMWDAQSGQMRAWQPPDGELWQNVEEAGIGRTAPVGLFPPGSSPCGALDMAGNVWEWCASPYSGYPTEAVSLSPDYPPRQIGPSLRGGSYYLQNTRSGWGARYRFFPNIQPVPRLGISGVRACCSRFCDAMIR